MRLATLAAAAFLGLASTANGAEQSDPFSEFHNLVTAPGVVADGTGTIRATERITRDYRFESSTFQVEEDPQFPTRDRKLVKIGENLNNTADVTYLFLPGWGEGPGQIGEKELVQLQTAYANGMNNPQYLYAGPSGRGTESYQTACGKISKITVEDEIRDTQRLLGYLESQDLLQGKIILVGHSMGALDILTIAKNVSETHDLIAIEMEMPVPDEPFGLFNTGFIWRVLDYVPEGVGKGITGHGCIALSQRDYTGKMLSNPSNDPYTQEYAFLGAPSDSARRFMGAFLTVDERFDTESLPKDIPYLILDGIDDHLAPNKMAQHLSDRLQEAGMTNVRMFDYHGPHAFSSSLSDEQFADLTSFYSSAFPQ